MMHYNDAMLLKKIKDSTIHLGIGIEFVKFDKLLQHTRIVQLKEQVLGPNKLAKTQESRPIAAILKVVAIFKTRACHKHTHTHTHTH